jgi:hypothetical protein
MLCHVVAETLVICSLSCYFKKEMNEVKAQVAEMDKTIKSLSLENKNLKKSTKILHDIISSNFPNNELLKDLVNISVGDEVDDENEETSATEASQKPQDLPKVASQEVKASSQDATIIPNNVTKGKIDNISPIDSRIGSEIVITDLSKNLGDLGSEKSAGLSDESFDVSLDGENEEELFGGLVEDP